MRSCTKVLVVGPELILQWTESTTRALESLGCRVRCHFYNRSGLRSRIKRLRQAVSHGVGLALPAFPQPLLQWYGARLAVRSAPSLVDEAKAFQPDVVLILKGESLQASTLQQLKAKTRATLAVWWVDHPFMNAETRRTWRYVPDCIPLYDHCFVFDHEYEEPLRAAGARSVSFLPCAADPEVYRPQALTDVDRARYGTSVNLIGVYSEQRARIVEALSREPGLGLWGPGWRSFLAGRCGGDTQAFHGESLLPAEACKVYNAGAVNLNTHHPQTRRGGLNTRSFEIPAAGGFELTDYVPEMESLLEPGREVVVYRSPEEARNLAQHYVKVEDERRRIAEAGHRRVLAEHTYRHRMQTLLKLVTG